MNYSELANPNIISILNFVVFNLINVSYLFTIVNMIIIYTVCDGDIEVISANII